MDIGGHEAGSDGDPSHTVAVPRGVSRMSPMSSAHDTWLSSICDCGHLAILNAEEPELTDRCQDGAGSKEPGYLIDRYHDGDGSWDDWCAYDNVKGSELPAKLVYDARRRELEYLSQRKVYEYASTSRAYQRTGRRPLRLKWIDTNKGGTLHPNIRSRLVCTEVRPKGVEAIFAATPPLESLRILMVILSQQDPGETDDPLTLTLADVSRAHFLCQGRKGSLYTASPRRPEAWREGHPWAPIAHDVRHFRCRRPVVGPLCWDTEASWVYPGSGFPLPLLA